jgi:signal peptide peptidase SppA
MGVEHILTEIVNRPLMVTPAKLEVILSILNSRSESAITPDFSALLHMNSVSGQEVQAKARPINQVEPDEELFIEVIPVLGSMVARNHGWGGGDDSGLRSYRQLMMDMNAAKRNPEIGGIILDMDTFGGMSAGCERVTRFIAEVNAVKPVYAVVDLNAYSAGYSIASACSKIILTDQTAGVGSIGCIAIHCDISKQNEKEGLNFTVVTFGAKKDQFSPLRPLEKDELSALQKSVAAHGMKFAETVAELRNMKLADVLATEAGAFSGKQAIDIGLADEICSFDEAVAMLADEIETRKKTSFTQTFQEKGAKDMAEPLSTKERMEKMLAADDGPAAIKELGFIGIVESSAAMKEEVTKVRAELVDVAELCQLGGLSTADTVDMLKSGADAVQARKDIQVVRAEKSKAQTVKSTITPLSGDGKHPLIASCEALGAKK